MCSNAKTRQEAAAHDIVAEYRWMFLHAGDVCCQRIKLRRHGDAVQVLVVALYPALRHFQHDFKADGGGTVEKAQLDIDRKVLEVVEHSLVDAVRCEPAHCKVTQVLESMHGFDEVSSFDSGSHTC